MEIIEPITSKKQDLMGVCMIFLLILDLLTQVILLISKGVTVTSREIIDYLFNATNIRMFEARNVYKIEISKRS